MPFDVLRTPPGRGLPVSPASLLAVRPEPEITVPVLRLTGAREDGPPERSPRPFVLLVSHRGADPAFRLDPGTSPDDPRASRFARSLGGRFPGAILHGCDVRGTGASEPGTVGPGQATDLYGSGYLYAAHARMWGEPLLGRRVSDVLAAWRVIARAHTGPGHLCGDRWGSLPALLAAAILLEEEGNGARRPASVTLSGLPASWRAMTADDRSDWPAALRPFGVLKHFDLPDVLAAVRSRLGDRLTLEARAGTRGFGG